jgi:zinc transporter, ZIP family
MAEAINMGMYISFLILLGTLVGGGAVVFIRKVLHRNYLYLNVFCGGMLAGLLGFDLVPEMIDTYQPIGIFSGIGLGIFFMVLIDKYTHKAKHLHVEHFDTLAMLFVALLFHSIPTGIALGMNVENSHFQDPALLSAILIHQIPEGMVLMVSVLYARIKVKTFWLLCLLLSLSIGINTFLGITLEVHSIKLRTLFMGAAIGTLGYVTFHEILWKGIKKQLTMKMTLVAILGVVFLRLLHLGGSFGLHGH